MKRIWLYRCAVFLSGFLLFQVELMLSKAMLPGFGGSYLVWAASVVFFQAVLLLGYLYTHSAQRLIGIVRYAPWHSIVLFLPFIVFPYRFDRLAGSVSHLSLAGSVFFRLLIFAGLPFFVLSTASVLLQSWFYNSDSPHRDNPYVLYGASNLGSVLGLLTYPVFFEPFFTLTQQGYIWWAGYAVFVVLHILCLPRMMNGNDDRPEPFSCDKQDRKRMLNCFLLSLAGSFSLLAVTNLITFDIASISFLWAMPLSIYLATFILVFKRHPWYPQWTKTLFTWILPVGMSLYLASLLLIGFPVVTILLLQLAILFIICLNCHGSLAGLKPSGRGLTHFYLAIAAGGFAGSFLVGMVIPRFNTFFVEYPASFLLAVGALGLTGAFYGRGGSSKTGRWAFFGCLVIIIALIVFPWAADHFFKAPDNIIFVVSAFCVFVVLRLSSARFIPTFCILFAVIVCSPWIEQLSSGSQKAIRLRNYYGVYLVMDKDGQRHLKHGTTLHGRQYLSGPLVNTPLSYYHPTTPIGELLRDRRFKFRNTAMVGLGTGAIAAYMGSGQSMTIYELDPADLSVAERYFSYLRFAREKGAVIKCIFGDGRVLLRHVPDSSYDLLIIDAFSSGVIPFHLLTREAIQEYMRVLTHDGLLLLHVSNCVFDLRPVIARAAKDSGFYVCLKANDEAVHDDADMALWMAVCRDKNVYERLVDECYWLSSWPGEQKNVVAWTDQYVNFFSVLRLQ